MSPQDPQAAALLAHVVSQMENNVNFLVSQNYISHADALAILNKLPNVNQAPSPSPGGFANLTSGLSNMGFNRNPTPRAVPPAPAPPPPTALPQARALWPYAGQDADDLIFDAGDVIEIVEETNADWWKGRVNGKEGLFPSTYVEKLAPPIPTPSASGYMAARPTPTKAYKPFGAALHGTNVPPPPGQGVNSVGLQEQGGQEAKKDKYGAYKNTLAHSAAGGVGFGAGAAIGGGLVRAIF